MALNAPVIVAAALVILDEYGLADLTMRRLADALDVKAGALYWHFPNKQTLLAAIADEVLSDRPEPAANAHLGEWLEQWAHGLRGALLAHRDAAELVASARAMNLGSTDPAETVRTRLTSTGMTADAADATAQALLHFVLGHVTEEQTRTQLVGLGLLDEMDASRSERYFRHGVQLLVAGVRSVLPG